MKVGDAQMHKVIARATKLIMIVREKKWRRKA